MHLWLWLLWSQDLTQSSQLWHFVLSLAHSSRTCSLCSWQLCLVCITPWHACHESFTRCSAPQFILNILQLPKWASWHGSRIQYNGIWQAAFTGLPCKINKLIKGKINISILTVSCSFSKHSKVKLCWAWMTKGFADAVKWGSFQTYILP